MARKKGVCATCAGPTARNTAVNCAPCRVAARKVGAVRSHPDYGRYWQMKRKYDLTKEQFEAMWEACGGKCGICQNPLRLPERRQGQALDVCAIDHDHETSKVRGLLCFGCNKGLGLFKDSTALLTKAKEYLNGTKTGINPTCN